MILKFLLEKEFKQFRRNPLFPKLVFVFPLVVMLVFPWVTTFEVRDVRVEVIDNDNTSTSRKLIEKIEGSKYFKLTGTSESYGSAYIKVETGQSDVLLDIPRDFEKNIVDGRAGAIQISANAVNGIKGSLGGNYLSEIVREYVKETMQSHGVAVENAVNVIERDRYNQYLDYKAFMIPALITMILIMLCGFLPTLNIVSEKERGTIEQINVTPVNKWAFILAKLIPYWVMGFVSITIGFVVGWLVYGFLPEGGFLAIYVAAAFFILVMSGIGLIISNYSSTMQQSMFVMFFVVMVFILMSGLFTPIRSMPMWAQCLAALNPPKYFITIMRSVYLKGGGFAGEAANFLILAAMAVIINILAVISYRKRN